MKVYVVTSGEYSDKSISGIFSSREKAQSYIDANHLYDDSYFSRTNDFIGEFNLDNGSLPETVIATLDVENNVITFGEDCYDENSIEYYELIKEFKCRVNFNKNSDVMRKSVYDKYAEWKAQQAGI